MKRDTRPAIKVHMLDLTKWKERNLLTENSKHSAFKMSSLVAGPRKVNLELTRQWSLWASSHSAGPAGAEGPNGLNQGCALHATGSALQARSAHWPAVARL